ncbi:MAG: hypothetical protein LAO20_13500 [Acidobacteriia bacterium]|nr:hypothetical protein [Terriglobia bacterium]
MIKQQFDPIVPLRDPQKTAPADAGAYCPTCGSKMKESRCKLVCKTCGFFLGCSDFY